MLLALARIAVAPVIALSAAAPAGSGWTVLAFGLFTVVAVADLIDHLFMRWNAERSPLCIMVERTGDRVMVLTVLAVVIGMSASYRGAGTGVLSSVPAILVAGPALLIVIREILVTALREYLGAAALPVTRLAQTKTALQIGAVFLLLLAHALPALDLMVSVSLRHDPQGVGAFDLLSDSPFERAAVYLGVAMLWAAAALTVSTAVDYYRAGWPLVREREDG